MLVAIVVYPTLEETAQHLDELRPAERAHYEDIVRFNDRFDREQLKHPDQLPALEGNQIHLLVGPGARRGQTNAHPPGCDILVWSEPAVWEGYWRYKEVLDILVPRYGMRLVDLEPTPSSVHILMRLFLHLQPVVTA